MTPGAGRLLYVVATRSSATAIAPVRAQLQDRLPAARHALVHAHSKAVAPGFGSELRLPDPDYFLDVAPGTPVSQTTMAMERVERVIEVERPDLIVLADDSAWTLSAALTALKLHIPTARLDAGLRTFDRHTPDEINRVIMDAFADLLFTNCGEAGVNLRAEGTDPECVHLVGSPSIDTLIAHENRFGAAQTARRFRLAESGYLLVILSEATLANPARLGRLLGQLGRLGTEMPVVMPAPFEEPSGWASQLGRSGVRVVRPLGYLDLLSLQSTAAAVITDSGLVQDETAYLGIPCLTMRARTERITSLNRGTNAAVGEEAPSPARVKEAIEGADAPSSGLPPLWDGCASARLAEVVEAKLAELEEARPLATDLTLH